MRASSVDGDYDTKIHGNNILVAASWHIIHRTLNYGEDGRTRWPATLREVQEVQAIIKFLSQCTATSAVSKTEKGAMLDH